MDLQMILSLLITILWIILLVVMIYFTNKYGMHRKEAFSAMRKNRILVYSVPLIFSIIIAAYIHSTDYTLSATYILVIGCRILACPILFDALESKKLCENKHQA